ncbi:MAG: hypothetical protein U0U70_04315 [Chitinophagaceae bacterium]
MKEEKKAELKKETWELAEILFLALESLKIVEYLIKDEADDDKVYSKRMNAFFVYSRSIYWRVIVIELSKLLTEKSSEQYNIYKFISKLKPHGHYGDAKISTVKIEKWEKALTDNKDSIDNLILQRDKLYAHTDKNSKSIPNMVTLTKTRELVTIIQEIIRKVYLTVFESSFMVDSPINAPVENLQWIISTLANEKKERESPLRKLAKHYGIEGEFKE